MLKMIIGACATDDDCAEGLVCWERTAGEETRAFGCSGVGGSGLPDMDVCLKPEDMPTSTPTNPPTKAPTFAPNQLLLVSDRGPVAFPLQHCQGMFVNCCFNFHHYFNSFQFTDKCNINTRQL